MLEEDEELPGEGEHYESHPLWQEVACSQQFKQFGKLQRHTKNQHINVSEVQAALEAEEEHGRRHPRSYYVHLVDSQVAAACLVKGRSSSWQLNRLLRQSLVTHLSHGCKPFYGYIRSQFNPGDDPTRGVVVREPVVEEAAWLTRLKEGEPGGMDDFLVSIGLGLRQMAGLPDPNELLADAPYDYRRAKEQEHTPPNFIHQSRSPTIHIPKKINTFFPKNISKNSKINSRINFIQKYPRNYCSISSQIACKFLLCFFVKMCFAKLHFLTVHLQTSHSISI